MDKLMLVLPFVPLSLAIIFGISQLLMQVFVPAERRVWLSYVGMLEMSFLGLATVLCYTGRAYLPGLSPADQNVALQSYSFLDGFALFFYLLLIAAGFVTILSSSFYLEREGLPKGEYYSLIFFSLAGMMILASAGDLMTLFVGLEIMSMAVYILVGYRRNSERSNEGAFKYFLLGSMASAILLYGIALTYGTTGTVDLQGIQRFYSSNSMGPLGGVGLLLLLGGLAFKVSAVPFHNWAPDAYEGAPMPITGFMATAVKAAAFALLLKVLGEAFIVVRSYWVEAVMALAAVTMITGNVLAFVQQNIKRMLAYSSIAHTGYLLMGVASLTLDGESQVRAAILYYLFIYVMSSLGVFLALTYLSSKDEAVQNIDDFAGLSKAHPFSALMLALFMFSFIGVPPLGGFFAKYFLFGEALRQQQTLLVAFAILNSILSVAYYLRIVGVMYLKEPVAFWNTPLPQRPASIAFMLGLSGIITIWAGFGPVNLLGLIPGLMPLVEWLKIATVM